MLWTVLLLVLSNVFFALRAQTGVALKISSARFRCC